MNFNYLTTDEVFNFTKFEQLANEHVQSFQDEHPFPHIVLDGLFNEKALDALINEFPLLDSNIWQKIDNPEIQIKLRSNWQNETDISPTAQMLVYILNSGRFLRSLSKLTGISGLIPDLYYTGGGLNQILKGGQLALHVDGTWHDLMAVHRRINVIVFLNKDWKDEYGGHLQYWDENLTKCEKKIRPDYNRMVVFNTNDFTYHGHPEPLECPENISRKSLILYYYTSTRPDSDLKSNDVHRALFTKLSEINKKK